MSTKASWYEPGSICSTRSSMSSGTVCVWPTPLTLPDTTFTAPNSPIARARLKTIP
jgi:hypothetical protein